MAKERTNAAILGDLGRFLGPLQQNSAELAHLEVSRLKLENIYSQAHELLKRKAALTAGKQEASKQLRTILGEGERLANALRKMLVEHYGARSEKLAEFGLQPFRGRKVKPAAQEPEAPTPPSDPAAPSKT